MRCFFWLLFLLTSVCGQLSKPIVHDTDVDIENNKFLRRKPELDKKEKSIEEDEEIITSIKRCPSNVHLRWMSQVSSSIYGSPLITDLFSDGHKEIIVPSFVHFLEVLESADGAAASGWPVYHRSHLHGSPFLHDFDRDGVLDVGIGTYNGEILFYKDTGEKMPLGLSIPHLKVKKRWYVGLNPDPIDHSHLDVGVKDTEKSQQERNSTKHGETTKLHNKIKTDDESKHVNKTSIDGKVTAKDQGKNVSGEAAAKITQRRQLLAEEHMATVENEGHQLTREATDSFEVFKDLDTDKTEGDDDVLDLSNRNFRSRTGTYDHQEVDDETYRDLYQHAYDFDHDWEDEDYAHTHLNANTINAFDDLEHVYLDPHLMSTPVIADIDNDGQEELIVAVSYFYDETIYSKEENRHLLPKDIEIEKYLAGGIVVFDLVHRYVRWSTHLDMTTQTVQYGAHMFASPSIVDIDKDGKMEIIIGNNVGFLYVLDCDGNSRQGWPKQMGFIVAKTLVADLNNDGNIEILAGDVTGNGELDIVFGTISGHIYVLDGKTGQDRAPFPFRIHGEIRSPITITKLHESPGQQLIFTAFDGFLYIVDGETACVDARDIGEDSYSMVLVDDVTGNGLLDLVVSTMNGNVLLFETESPFHPLRTWTSEGKGTEVMISRSDYAGVFASAETRQKRDIRGDRFTVRFTILDHRKPINGHAPYNASIVLKNIGAREMNAGTTPIIGLLETYNKSGTYEIVLPCPKSRSTALIQIKILDKHSIEFFDEFPLSFHMHWHKFIKWLVVLPFILMAMAMISIKPMITEGPLPS